MPRINRNNRLSTPKGVEYWRERWLHEDDLINHRLTWLLVAQTILFAGCAPLLDLLFDAEKKLEGCNRDVVLHVVKFVFPFVGIGIAACIGLGVAGAIVAMTLIHHYANREVAHSFEYGIHWLPSVMGQFAGIILPVLFAGIWLFLDDLFSEFT
jgi:hypothetical protein